MYPRYITRISQRDEVSGESLFFLNVERKLSEVTRTIFVDGTLTVVDERVKVDKRRFAIAGALCSPRGRPVHVTTRDNDDDDDVSRVAFTSTRRGQARAVRLSPRDTALYAERAAASVDISR